MPDRSLQYRLAEAIESFEKDYKSTLDNYNLDENISEALYMLGADIKHALDAFAAEIIAANER